ncbi:MAG: hypothetical protein ACKOAV_11830, partial [Bacteroidota bacterium]
MAMNIRDLKSFWALLSIGVAGGLCTVGVVLLLGGSLTAFKAEEEKAYREKFWNEYRVYAVPVPEEMTFAGEKV